MLERDFRFDGCTVRVASEDAGSVRWLEEFLAPAFEVGEPGRGAALRVRLTIDAEAYERCERDLGTGPAPERACFALDTQIMRHPARMVDDRPLVVDARLACAFRFDGDGVELVAHPRAEKLRMPFMRVVREIASEACRRRPRRLQLHASALAVGDRAVLFAGPKLAGKTTLMIHALGAPGAAFLSNDRVFVALDGEAPAVRGVPTLVSIRPGTLDRFPRLRGSLPDVRLLSLGTLQDLRRARAERPALGDGERASLSPPQLCAVLGVRARTSAPLAALVFPEISGDVAAWEIERLPPTEARARLADCRYGLGTDRAERTVFEDLVGGDAAADEAGSMDALVGKVPAFACRLGPAAYDDPRGAEMLLAALADSPSTPTTAAAPGAGARGAAPPRPAPSTRPAPSARGTTD